MLTSPPEYSINERRSSPYLSRISASSSLIKAVLKLTSANKALKCSINFIISSYSALNLSCSRPVN